MKDTENNDRYNLAKFKILMTLSTMESGNSVMIAKRTFKTVPQTTPILRTLLRQKRIKLVQFTSKNDGCSSRFKITNNGRKYLFQLKERFIKGLDLNLYNNPTKVQLKDIDIQWWEQEKEIMKKQADKTAENLKNPLSVEYAVNELRKMGAIPQKGALTQKALPPKALTQEESRRIIAEVMEKHEH